MVSPDDDDAGADTDALRDPDETKLRVPDPLLEARTRRMAWRLVVEIMVIVTD